MGVVLLAGEEAEEWPPPPGGSVADRAREDGVGQLERVEEPALGGLPIEGKSNLTVEGGEAAEVVGEDDPDQSVWTSRERTGGRWSTTADHESPSSADAYTWPPVVPT